MIVPKLGALVFFDLSLFQEALFIVVLLIATTMLMGASFVLLLVLLG